MKLTTELPKDEKTFGAWLNITADSDVHVYTQKSFAVIGQNYSYKDKVHYSDMAIAFGPDGKATFQYDDGGKAVHVDLPLEIVHGSIIAMLESLKGFAKASAKA